VFAGRILVILVSFRQCSTVFGALAMDSVLLIGASDDYVAKKALGALAVVSLFSWLVCTRTTTKTEESPRRAPVEGFAVARESFALSG
jgi:hypothetical protein